MSLADDHPDHQFPRLSRRDLLRASAAAGLSAAVGFGFSSRAGAVQPTAITSPKPSATSRARNVIFMVSDGMSTGTLTLADMYIRRKHGRASWWMDLWGRPGARRAAARTHALDSLVTDSAAGGSAWGCGVHLNNGSINVAPEGVQLMPILVRAKQAGKAVGVVTTARVTHATPASFYANTPRRDYEGMIGSQFLQRPIDVALGGGAHFFPDSETAKHPDVRIVRTAEELRAASPSGRLLGLFDRGHVPFVLDRTPAIPGLVEMTRAAISRLEKSTEGFVLQIEGGRIDHAAHSNDAPSLLREQVEFDDAIGAVLEWIGKRDDTLLILTSDHGNANPGLTLYGEQGNKAFARLESATKSFDWIDAQMAGSIAATARLAKLEGAVKAAMGYDLNDGDRELLADCLQDRRAMAFVEANKWTSVLGAILADRFGVAFVSPNHTSDYVEVTAIGPGSETIGGCIDNIDLHGVMVAAAGLPEAKLLPGMDESMKALRPAAPD